MLLAEKEESKPTPAKKPYPKKEWTLFVQRHNTDTVFIGTAKKGNQSVDIRIPDETFTSKKGHVLVPVQAKNPEGEFVRVGWVKEVTSEKARAKNLVLNGSIDLTPVGMDLVKKITGFRLPKKEGKPTAINFVESKPQNEAQLA